MAVLARVNYTAQQRQDLHHLLLQESFSAFDMRSLITSITGTSKTYIARGLQVVGKTELTIQIKVADSLVFNPLDNNGSFYLGLSDDADISLTLQSSQSNIFVEAKFINVTQAPLSTAAWDPLALTGEDASGTEFSAAVDSQNVLTLVISANTIGFSTDAIPLLWASTSASSITELQDRRPLLFRLGSGGSTPNPLNKYGWASSRTEPVTSGTGTGEETTSPWRSRDTSGALNDKAFESLKDLLDAMMSRISETSGSPIWYLSGLSVSPVANISLNQTFFDTLGHSITPSSGSSFIWKRNPTNLALCGEGTIPLTGTIPSHHDGLIKWQSNYSKLEWQLGGTFQSSSYRNYLSGSVRFSSPAPDDKGNVYLKLEREVPKGSGASVKWANNSSYAGFASSNAVSGQSGDFTGIAIGDFIRKESEGYSRYYRVMKMRGSVTYDASPTSNPGSYIDAQNYVADSLIVALELEDVILGTPTTEPLRYFRNKYSNDDLYANQNIATNGYTYQDADFYWLGRRAGELFILKNYGTMQENEEATALNDASDLLGGSGDGGLVLEHALQAYYGVSGYTLKTGSGTLVTIHRRKKDNTVSTPNSSDNSGSLLTYTITAPVGLMTDGDELWVRLSETTSGALTAGSVTNTTDDINNTDTSTNKWEIRPASTSPLKTHNNENIFLLARRTIIGGQDVLLFQDGSVLGLYGKLINENVEITGETKLTPRTNQGVLFVSETISGQVDDEASQLFYSKSGAVLGARTFRITDNQINLATTNSSDVNFLTNLGQKTVTIGSVDSTTYLPGDLVVAGNTVAAQVSQVQSEDKLITLGVGNVLNGGYNAGVEVADNTINGTNFSSTISSSSIVITLAGSPGYTVGDVIGVSATTGVGGITAGEIGGQYTIVASLVSAGDATISGSTLTVKTAVTATSTASSSTTPPKAFKAEWAIKVSGSDGTSTGFTSWKFQTKNVTTTPTLTPFSGYGIVPTANSTSMLATRLPFVNDDNVGPSGVDSTLNFSGNLTWNNSTNTLAVTGFVSLSGTMIPGANDVYDIGTPLLQWQMLYLGPSSNSGITWGTDTNLYRPSANLLKTDDSLEVVGSIKVGLYEDFVMQGVNPVAPVSGSIRVFTTSNLTWQRTSDGEVKLLTNNQGNVYHEDVDIVAVPAGNNQRSTASLMTIPKDSNWLVGQGISIQTVGTFATVIVTKLAHGLVSGDTVTVTTSVSVGGISPANLSVSNAVISVTGPNTFNYTALAAATFGELSSLDLVKATTQRYYTLGDKSLEVYLDGQLLLKDRDYTETSTSQITFIQPLVLDDVITFRIDSNGGQVVILSGSLSSLQAVYNGGNSITTVTTVPVSIFGPSGESILVVSGDMTVTGLII
jgi:hypothetical protein